MSVDKPEICIREARVRLLRRPLRSPIAAAFGLLRHRDAALLVLRGDDGAMGVGEAAPLPERGTEGLAAAQAALEAAARRLEGSRLPPEGCAAVPGCGPAASFALSSALADLRARANGAPLAAWLARGEEGALPALPSAVPVNALLVADAPPELEVEAAAALRRGHRSVKLKVGQGSLARDVDRIAAVRGVVGPGVRIRADANGAWDEAEAERRLAALRPFRLAYIEQPVGVREVEGLARLRRQGAVPVAADESAADMASLRQLLAAEAADFWILKPALLGGLEPAREAVALAREHGVAWGLTSLLDGAVAQSAVLHLAASLGPELPDCGLGPVPGLAGDVAALPEIQGGAVPLPGGVGLGLELVA